MKPSEATAIPQCHVDSGPELVCSNLFRPPSQADSARDILSSFYNGELFRIVVTYDKDRTEGMTAEDIVDVSTIPVLLGPPSK